MRLNNKATLLRVSHNMRRSEAAPARTAICSLILAALPVRGGGARLFGVLEFGCCVTGVCVHGGQRVTASHTSPTNCWNVIGS